MNRDIENYQDEYQSLPFEKHQAHFRRLEHLKVCRELKPLRIVEIGCGMLPLFVDYHDFEKMEVIEPGESFAENARNLGAQHSKSSQISVQNCFLEDCNVLENHSYDLVILSALLHEVPCPQTFLKQAKKIGGNGARYLITVPNSHSFHRQLALRCGLIESLTELSNQQIQLQQSRTYSLDSLTHEIKSAGLQVESQKSIILKPFTHGQMEGLLANQILTLPQVEALAGLSDLLPELGSELLVIAH